MTKPEISGIAPFLIVKSVPAALLFYRDRLDEAQMATWIRQAAALPGWVP